MTRPTQLSIDVDALRHNLAVMRAHAPRSRIWAVVKANAYGHGLQAALAAFADADGLALLDVADARLLREMGWRKPLLMLEGAFDTGDLDVIAELGLDAVVVAEHQARDLIAAARVPPRVWIKLNTGMNRLGFSPIRDAALLREIVPAICARLGAAPGWMTHFSDADADQGWCTQLACFQQALPALAGLCGGAASPLSLANTAATLSAPPTHADWVRPGIGLYGGSPFATQPDGRSAEDLGLRAGQAFTSRLIAVQRIAAGETVGYGSRFRAQRASRIGVVAAGYADGYPRNAPDGTPVWVAGRIVPLAGRVSMDMITVDITDHPAAGVGSPVELWGTQLAVDDVARCCDTIGYELMTRITARVPRVIHGA
jgi:alanine racemase